MRTLVLMLLAGCSPSPANNSNPDLTLLADMAVSYDPPAGYTLTPFISTVAEHVFNSAEDALTAGRDYAAVIDTDVGRIVIDLSEAETPITVNSFVWLALHHFYDGIAFHRVINGFMAQTGDPTTLSDDTSDWGTGGPGYYFGVEIVPAFTYDAAGVVGMARSNDRDTNGSQFFITFAAAHSLDGDYTIFGHVIEGLDVLPKIVRGEPPATPTRMQKVFIVEK
jgi:cyclophilin family peptidyl-prolyl cis-trans isomerase